MRPQRGSRTPEVAIIKLIVKETGPVQATSDLGMTLDQARDHEWRSRW
jgi:hypothetical protein